MITPDEILMEKFADNLPGAIVIEEEEEEETTIISQCLDCKHFIDDTKFTCKAFPDGIPDDLVFNKVSHKKPYEGDKGIQFEEVK